MWVAFLTMILIMTVTIEYYIDKPTIISNDAGEEEQYDFDEWFEGQMDIHDNGPENSSGKEDIFVKFLDKHHEQYFDGL